MPDRISTFPVQCVGGLVVNTDPLTQSTQLPGSAVRMINYEPALQGGYRRISGFENSYGTVPGATGEPVLGVCVFSQLNDGIFACRKPSSGNNYFHYWDDGTSAWVTPTTVGSPTMTGVTKVRFAKLHWTAPKLVMVDGVNPAAVWDGTNYTQITHANAPTDPSLVESFASHLWLAGDPAEPYNLYFSAPLDETDFAPANGAGVINVGFPITQIKAFRDILFIFGVNEIKKILGNNIANFQLLDVTKNLGTVAPDSVVEFNADLLFLGPDGMRPVSATDRIGDIELATVSRPIQSIFEQFTTNEDLTTVTVVTIRKKSQFRLFFADQEALGLIGGLRGAGGASGSVFEYSQLVGMEVNCADSGYIGDEEYVIHGDSVGRVHRQESGNSFNGTSIFSLYQTPYYFMDDPLVRKIYYDVSTFLRAEGTVTINLGINFNYGSPDVSTPTDYSLTNTGAAAYYGTGIYDTTDIYDGNPSPVKRTTIAGSGDSVSFSFVTVDTQPSHTIQALAVSYALGDRR